jgi:FkbM family methyltransferase
VEVARLRVPSRPALLACALIGLLGCRDSSPRPRPLPIRVDLSTLLQTYGQPLYSQDDEETLIRAFFADRHGGFFLDVGSGDPVRHSTTYYLEKHLRWTGIAVDALVEYAEPYTRQRPGTRFFAYFAGKKSGAAHDFFAREERDFSSATGRDPRGGNYQKRAVPTIALDDLLDREHVTRVDFLSMDIEGAEPAALAGLDLRRYAPELACIEIASPEAGRAIAERFTLAGCREVTAYRAVDAINRYYTCR